MTTVPASFETLMDQAASTTDVCLGHAIRILDYRFGEGFSQKHPELAIQLVASMVGDFHSGSIGKAIGELADNVGHLGNQLSDFISN